MNLTDKEGGEPAYWRSPLYDPIFLSRMRNYQHITKYDMADWLRDHRNDYYIDAFDIAVFAYETPFLFTGHYFFESRGKEAKEKALSVLRQLFDRHKNLRFVQGLTPQENKAARWMTRQLGFKSHGLLETAPDEFCELFLISREELK